MNLTKNHIIEEQNDAMAFLHFPPFWAHFLLKVQKETKIDAL